jgi:surface antigen
MSLNPWSPAMRLPQIVTVGACVLSLGACETMSDREMAGTVVGGALGGLVGAQFGHHGDRALATGLGVALGAFVGNRIGRALDERDRIAHDRAAQEALWASRSGYPYTWSGQYAAGEVRPGGDAYRDGSGRSCRRFTDTVTFRDGYRRSVEGVACLNPDGQWVVVG